MAVKKLKKKWRDEVQAVVDVEGFGYTFLHYSDFDSVEDKEFHKRREAFIKAADDLRKYAGVIELTMKNSRQKVHYSSGGDTVAAITFLIVSFVFAEYVIRVCKDFHF